MMAKAVVGRLCLTGGGTRVGRRQLGAVVAAQIQQTAAGSAAAAAGAAAALRTSLLLLTDRSTSAHRRTALTWRQSSCQRHKGRPAIQQPTAPRRGRRCVRRHRCETAKGGSAAVFAATVGRRQTFVQCLSVQVLHRLIFSYRYRRLSPNFHVRYRVCSAR